MTRALVVVDIQNDYFPGGGNPLDGPEAAAGKASTRTGALGTSGSADAMIHAPSRETLMRKSTGTGKARCGSLPSALIR